MKSTRRRESWPSDTSHRLGIRFKWIMWIIAMRSLIRLAAVRIPVGSSDDSPSLAICMSLHSLLFSAIPIEGLPIGSDAVLRRLHSLSVPFGRTQPVERGSASDHDTDGQVQTTAAHSSRALLSLSLSRLESNIHCRRSEITKVQLVHRTPPFPGHRCSHLP
jgi:hypothetical protein